MSPNATPYDLCGLRVVSGLRVRRGKPRRVLVLQVSPPPHDCADWQDCTFELLVGCTGIAQVAAAASDWRIGVVEVVGMRTVHSRGSELVCLGVQAQIRGDGAAGRGSVWTAVLHQVATQHAYTIRLTCDRAVAHANALMAALGDFGTGTELVG